MFARNELSRLFVVSVTNEEKKVEYQWRQSRKYDHVLRWGKNNL